MYTRLTSPSRMSAHTTHSRSRSPWLWAFLIMFMIWGVWVLLPQPDHLAASSDIADQQQQHAKTFSSLANAQPATSPSDDLKSSSDVDEDVTEDTVVADAIKSLLDDDDEDSEIKSSSTSNSEETKEENNEDDEDDDDDDDEDDNEVIAQPTETSKPSAAVSLEPTSIVDIDIDNTPSQTSTPASSDSVENSNDGVGIVVHNHDDNIDNNSLVLEEPTKTIDGSQAQITSVPVDNFNDNGENEVKQGGKGDQEDDVEGEDSLVMSITAVSWPAGAVATEI